MSRHHPLPWLESSSLQATYTPDNNSFYGSTRPSAPTALTPRIRYHSATRQPQELGLRNMANWNMVWLQPKAGSASFDFTRAAGPGVTPGPEPLSPGMEKRLEHLSRPTVASAMKRETPWMKRYHVMSYMEGDRVSWSKQELRKDCDSLMWTDNGTIRSQTKI